MPTRLLLYVSLGVLYFATPLYSDTRYTFIVKKQEEKARNRWSISDWIEQRDRRRLMDLWLTLHSPSPYEFYLGGQYQFGRFLDNAYYGEWNIYAAAYASIAGIEVQRHLSTISDRWLGLFHLRILGFHNQATNLTLHGGIKREGRSGILMWNPATGATLTLYLNRKIGIQSLYRYFFSDTTEGVSRGGWRAEGGLFLEFGPLRVYGNYFYEEERGNQPSIRQGGILGTQIYL